MRIVLADDHKLVAEGLCRILRDSFDLVDVVSDGRALIAAVARLLPDVVVTDIEMPLLSGLDAIRAIRMFENPPGIVVLTMHAEASLATEVLRAGATAYVLKNAAGTELERAVRDAYAGRRYVSPLLDALLTPHDESPAAPPLRLHLTPRQCQVLELTARGYRMKQVADVLHISRRTVESHKYQLMETLGARSTSDLVQHAIRLGLIEVENAAPTGERRWSSRSGGVRWSNTC
jgi:DNA-binding NarL/FixJ family response regulator